MAYSLGIDLGTSNVKAMAIDNNGHIAAQTSCNYQIIRTGPDKAEQDPAVWWNKTQKAIKKIIVSLGEKKNCNSKIKAIGVTGQMHGLVALDKNCKVIRPAMIWADNRAQKEVLEIKNNLTHKQNKRLANPVVTNFTAPKVLWLKKNQPEIWTKIYKIMLPKDFIVYSLTGNIITDASDASGTLLFDVEKKKWAWDIISKFNFGEEIFPQILEPGGSAGKLKNSLACKFNLDERPEVIIAGGDAPVSALANGIRTENTAGISLGTAGQIIMPIKSFNVEPEFRLHTMAFIRPGWWFIMGAILSAGYNLKWWFESIKNEIRNDSEILTSLEGEIAALPPGSKGLIYLPYLLGERSPIIDPLSSGSFFGLRAFHEEIHFVRAIMEGVAYAFRWNLEIANEMKFSPEKIFLSGGGAKNDVWAQIIADVLKVPVYQSKKRYDPAYGAAILSAESINMISNINDILRRNIKEYKIYTARNNISKIYDEFYLLYKSLYQDNKEKMWELDELRKIVEFE